ncbi:Asp-tRNA(Asn)/Glu-tRNA(Gln) amidotransferase subunit GatC [Candidatus Saganbacteria bacterium]|nr:Asp-tRNA(Asn)/Glu-tRNA(Gln) amidotransferase subunit GatC [Candidatus Saganbacteria bacterium]
MQLDINHIAKLARLGLTEDEKVLYGRQLSVILDYAARLQKLDTNNIPPASHAIPMKNVWREDVAAPCTNTDEIVANGPTVENNMFRVPKIME